MDSTCVNELGWNDEDGNGRFHLMDSLHILIWFFHEFLTESGKILFEKRFLL